MYVYILHYVMNLIIGFPPCIINTSGILSTPVDLTYFMLIIACSTHRYKERCTLFYINGSTS